MSQGDSNISSSVVNETSSVVNETSLVDDDVSVKWEAFLLVYVFISFQLLLAVTVGAIVVSHSGVFHFVRHTRSGHTIYIISVVLWFIIQCFLLGFRKRCPLNCVFFLLWSVSFAFAVGFSCSFSSGTGKTVLEAVIMMSAVAVSLVLYSIWGTFKNRDFSLFPPCMLCILLVISIYVPFQIYHPFAKLSTSIFGLIAALGFCSHAFFSGNAIIKALSKNNKDDSICGPIFAATVFVYWHYLVSKPRIEDVSA